MICIVDFFECRCSDTRTYLLLYFVQKILNKIKIPTCCTANQRAESLVIRDKYTVDNHCEGAILTATNGGSLLARDFGKCEWAYFATAHDNSKIVYNS